MRWSICLLLLISCPAPAQDKPATDPRLQEILKRFPDADANKDGVLTRQEADAYRQKMRGAEVDKKKTARAAVPTPTFPDVHYGPHERQVFDFWKAESDKPTPLIVYIHGGGFVSGDKSSISVALLQNALNSGISVAAIHYRFVDGTKLIFPVPQHDGARAVQFMRSKAAEWNLDPKKVAAYGGSAGAGISMWLGYHDDLADPNSSDPVARQSTRLVAIGSQGGQIFYDPIKIKNLIGGRAWEHPSIFKVYGVQTPEQALHPTPELQKLYDESSAVTHLTRDDPPIFMIYSEPDIEPPADARPGQFIHHPRFAKALIPRLDKLGIAYVYRHTSETGRGDLTLEMLEFFKAQFAK
jgi:acetyl esterase/lipase